MADRTDKKPHTTRNPGNKTNSGGSRSHRTSRDREAAETVRVMREKDAERSAASAKGKRRRVKQMQTRVTILSIFIVLAVAGGAFYGAVQAGWLSENPPGNWSIYKEKAAENAGADAAQEAAETDAENESEPETKTGTGWSDPKAEEKAGGMRGVIGLVKIAADDPNDVDGDGIPNQEDIFKSAKEYIATKPKYESRYYMNGYPDDGYGVCTDVVGFAFLGAGFNLQRLVTADINDHMEEYPEMEKPDPKIDFRRVQNLEVFFQHTAEVLTTDLDDPDEWQPGDIVTWERHIGIISDRKNSNGFPYVLHHAGPSQTEYEEDILEGKSRYTYVREITGHYRVK